MKKYIQELPKGVRNVGCNKKAGYYESYYKKS